MDLENIHTCICTCIRGRKIHVCNSENRMGKVGCNLGGRNASWGKGGGGLAGRIGVICGS